MTGSNAGDVARYCAAGNGDVALAPTGISGDLRKLQGYSAIPALDLTFLVPNWRMAPFDDLRMRQALALAIDQHAPLHDASRETDLPTIHIVPSGLPQCNGYLRDSADRTGDAALAQCYANSNCAGSVSACPLITLAYAGALVAVDADRVARRSARYPRISPAPIANRQWAESRRGKPPGCRRTVGSGRRDQQ
jgi:hypothetical protein